MMKSHYEMSQEKKKSGRECCAGDMLPGGRCVNCGYDERGRPPAPEPLPALAVGDVVGSLLYHTAVVVGFENGNPIIEAWGYGRTLGPVDRRAVFPAKLPSRTWFRTAVDSSIALFGDSCRPVHPVSKKLYEEGI